MSKPKYYGFGYVEKLVRRYPDQLQKEGTLQAEIACAAIKSALRETEKKKSGPERVQLITIFYIEDRYTIAGAADRLHISESLAKRWKSEFIYLVAEKMQLI